MELTTHAGDRANPIVRTLSAVMREFSRSNGAVSATLDDSNIRRKAPTSPLGTDDADGLVAQTVYAFFSQTPTSLLGALLPYATRLTSASPTTIPSHVEPSQAAQFVGERQPIPVISGHLDAGTLRLLKLSVIVLASREIVAASAGTNPMLEALVREAIALGTDAVLLGSGAGSDTEPPGLGHGALPLVGSDDAVADTKAMLAAGPASGMTTPLWIMNASQLIGATAANIVDGGRIGGAPVLTNPHVTIGDVWLIDAADLITNAGGAVGFARTEEAVVHAESDPLPVVDGTPATPVVSLWQMNIVGLRAVLPMSWLMRDVGRVIKLSGATW